jgi:uncharacterized cupin superfamily protein
MKYLTAIVSLFALSQQAFAGSQVAGQPVELSKADIAGKIFERSDMKETTHDDGHVTQSVTSLVSSDQKFTSGMYKSGKTRLEVSEPYGVDEFMYFLEGSVTLTSSDGTVQTIEAGEGITVPKEWTGTWETDGYTKIWVIYSGDTEGQ